MANMTEYENIKGGYNSSANSGYTTIEGDVYEDIKHTFIKGGYNSSANSGNRFIGGGYITGEVIEIYPRIINQLEEK